MNKLFWFLLLIVHSVSGISQLSGKVLSNTGEVLPYATIHIENTSIGTTSNLEGEYILHLEEGEYNLKVQYIGYETSLISIANDGTPQTLDIALNRESISVTEIIVTADAEDPAYEIIRQARKKRDLYRNASKSYQADLYIKGVVKMLDAPSSFMGQEIGDMDGMIDDSTRQGIVYLSESKSKVYAQAPDKIKEVMYASKVAGDDNGISFNQFSAAKFSFYDEFITFGRSLVSPLADNSFRHYIFKLEGTTLDEAGRMINKIKVSPKSDESPVFFGTIYIAEDYWYIHQIDLAFTGKAAKEAVFDTIEVKQLYNTEPNLDQQVLMHQLISFKMGVFSFKMGGTFSYFLSDYIIDPIWEKDPFSAEIFKIEKGSNELTQGYWDTIRPIPLTLEENKDYIRKDSLAVLWKSKDYLDSIDRKSNKFKWANILFGYSYSNSYKRKYYTYKSPLSTYQFNAVEGHILALSGRIRYWDDTNSTYWAIEPKISYGFADKQVKPSLKISQKYHAVDQGFWSLEGGRRYSQFDSFKPISEIGNTLTTLFRSENYVKLYDELFAEFKVGQEILNGLRIDADILYTNRSALNNNSDFSFFLLNDTYEPNNFIGGVTIDEVNLDPHDGIVFNTRIWWRPGQKYLNYGEFKDRIRSAWPDIIIKYSKAVPLANTELDYDHLNLTIQDRKIDMNLWGYGAFRFAAGTFLNKSRVEFPDFKHFHGNRVALSVGRDFLTQYKVLDYYKHSTTDSYLELFYVHHLDGYLMDRIPLIKHLGFKSIFGFSSYYQSNGERYVEPFIGIDDIGFGVFRGLRLDYALGFIDGKKTYSGLVLSLKRNL